MASSSESSSNPADHSLSQKIGELDLAELPLEERSDNTEYKKLIALISSRLKPSERNSKTQGRIRLLLYFDEAHTLTNVVSTWIKENPEGRNAYEVLLGCLNEFPYETVFSLFLSTNSHMSALAPTREQHKSLRALSPDANFNAPFTELPFDCHPDLPINVTNNTPPALKLEQVSTVEFMCKFGRPL